MKKMPGPEPEIKQITRAKCGPCQITDKGRPLQEAL